jgi:hypothetical protein
VPNYPPVTIKPSAGAGKQTFQSWAKKHGISAGVAADIQYWAKAYGINPYYFASVLLVESGAAHYGKDGKLKSSGQAGGIGQIAYSWIGTPQPWGDGHRITMKDIQSYQWNLRMSAYLLNSAINQYGYAGAYTQGYNPNDPNKQKAWQKIKSLLPKGQIPGGIGPVGGTASEAAGPNTSTQNMQAARQVLDPIYLAYTGRRASNKDIKNYLRNPTSMYELTNRLSDPKKNPRFYTSPIWKTNYPSYEEIWKSIFGPDSTPDRNAVRYAIVHNLGASFAQRLRDRPDYNTSQEYKGLAAQYGSQYSAIYGAADATAQAKIDMAVRKGWNADQWKAYLRAQPEWQGSGEFKKMAMGLSQSLGFEPGLGSQQTVLNAPQAPQQRPPV